jgi:hypothetical protein
VHQKRAHAALDAIAPEVEAVDKTISKPFDGDKDIFRRPALQSYLHVLLIVVSVLPILLYFKVI